MVAGASDTNASVEYEVEDEGEFIGPGDNSVGARIRLGHGQNTIKVEVTAEDGSTEQTYVIVVTRENPPRFQRRDAERFSQSARELCNRLSAAANGNIRQRSVRTWGK